MGMGERPSMILRGARLAGGAAPVDKTVVDVAVAGDRIVAVAPVLPGAEGAEEIALDGRLLFPGFVESHVHLDKSALTDRCAGAPDLPSAIAAVAAEKRAFTVEDIHARASETLTRCVLHGATAMRTHVEADPRIGLRGFEAIKALREDFAWAIDLQICVFPQEGLTNDPGTEALLDQAAREGADLIGGCPYADTDPIAQIARIFSLAREYDLDIDFHLDFHLDPARMDLGEICRMTEAHGMGGRVAAGHVSALSALPPDEAAAWARRMADAGVALTVLPATDLFLMGREARHLTPRGVAPAHDFHRCGVTCSLATNNVLNPFTPFGDGSLLRMANLYANAAQLGAAEDHTLCFDMVSSAPARLMGLDYGVREGARADLVALDARSEAEAVATLAPPLFVVKNGRRTVTRPAPVLHGPGVDRPAPGPV